MAEIMWGLFGRIFSERAQRIIQQAAAVQLREHPQARSPWHMENVERNAVPIMLVLCSVEHTIRMPLPENIRWDGTEFVCT